MHPFLFAHIHWLWAIFHWFRHGIYAPWTFGVFVFIGIAQAAIGWESGELAVRALPKETLNDRDRKRYLRLVRILATLLLPATLFIGLGNDRGQRDADDKANQARSDQVLTQSKLDQANARAKHYDDSFAAFAQSLDPSKLTVVQYAKLIQAQRDAIRISTSLPAATDGEEPLSRLSNTELKQNAIALARHLHGASNQMYDAEDGISRLRNRQLSPLYQSEQASQQTSFQMTTQTDVLKGIMNKILEEDVPVANQYRDELLRRLGPQAKPNAEFPPAKATLGSLNQFLSISSMNLNALANALPNSE
jgi:hypothetical protein